MKKGKENLLETIASADLSKVKYRLLTSWLMAVFYSNSENKKELLAKIAQEVKKRDVESIDLDEWVEEDPKNLEDFMTLMPSEMLKTLYFNIEKTEKKSQIKEIFENAKLRRMMNFNRDQHLF